MKPLQRLLLIISAVGITVLAGAGIAQADGPTWERNGGPIGVEGNELEGFITDGELTFNLIDHFEVGPCEAKLEGVVRNEASSPGTVTGGAIGSPYSEYSGTGSCPTSYPGCIAEDVAAANFNWPISFVGEQVSFELPKINFTLDPKTCPVPPSVTDFTLEGSLTTTEIGVAEVFEEPALAYENAEGMSTTPVPNFTIPVSVNGWLRLHAGEGGFISLKY